MQRPDSSDLFKTTTTRSSSNKTPLRTRMSPAPVKMRTASTDVLFNGRSSTGLFSDLAFSSSSSDDDEDEVLAEMRQAMVAENDMENKSSSASPAVPSPPLSPTDAINAMNEVAMRHVENGEYDNAVHIFQRVLAFQVGQYGDMHPAVASAYHNLGTIHAKRASILPEGQQQRHIRAQALECFQIAARTARDALGPLHPNVAVSLVRIGLLLQDSRQFQHAIVTFKEALRLRLAIFGVHHKLVSNIYNNLGLCTLHIGEFAEAAEYLGTAINIQRHVVEKEGSDQDKLELADTLFNLGGLCLEWIRREGPSSVRARDAEEAFAEALEVRG